MLRDLEGAQKVFHLTSGTQDLRMGRYPPIPINALLGVPYGATLRRAEGGQWMRHRRSNPAGGANDGGQEVTESNQNLAQDNSAQTLTPSEIRQLKGRCSGEEIVEALASNSSTFATKTKFSQEKYLRKKQQKHVQQVSVLQPTVFELCETYMKQSRGKMCGLRFDYLSAILCQANVHPGGHFLVLDCACGLVAAAMAQQIAGRGRVFRTFRGGCPDKGLVELDLGEAREAVRQVPLDVLQSPDPWSQEWLRAPPEIAADEEAAAADVKVKAEARAERVRRRQADMRELEARPLDAAVVVAGDEDAEIAAEALEVGLARLALGGRLVAYGQHLQPLAARQGAMRAGGGFVDVRLVQLFTREYQVLPQRTHPQMAADAQLCEGFLLTATKVADGVAACDGGEDGWGTSASAEKRRRVE